MKKVLFAFGVLLALQSGLAHATCKDCEHKKKSHSQSCDCECKKHDDKKADAKKEGTEQK